MIRSLLILFLSLVIFPCTAQLKIVNPSDNAVSLAIGHYTSKRSIKGWIATGWIKVAPHDSITLLPKGIEGNSFYYFGRINGCDQGFQGKYSLYIHPTDPFTVVNALSNTPLILTEGVTKVPYIKVDLPEGTVNYRFVLPKINCSQAGKRQGSWTFYLDRDKEETTKPEDATYVRSVSYHDGVPNGIVRDYFYPSKKLQWEGKLLSSDLNIKHGTCITYDENGEKREEATYQNGQLVGSVKRWDEAGKETIVRKSYRTVQVLSPQKGYLFSYYNNGKSRAVIPVHLPANTVAWYYEFTASRQEQEVAAAQEKFQLVSQLTKLVDETGMLKLATASLTVPPGGNICNLYLIKDARQSDLFEDKQEFTYFREGSRNNLTSAIVPINKVDTKNVILGLYNPDSLYGIHYALEVVAIVEESE